MGEEKRMIQGFEVKNAILIGGKEIILAQDLAAAEPYMVCNCRWDNPLGIDIYDNAVADSDYLDAMSEFLGRVSSEVQRIREQRLERGVTCDPLTTADCIPGSGQSDYKNQLVIIKPESMVASARTADQQLLWATHGNGCDPDARGQAVFCQNLFTGEKVRWERFDIAGVILPERIPEWALIKLQEMGIVTQPLISNVYFASADEAREKNEHPVYRESNRQNAACAEGIDKAIHDCYAGDYNHDFDTALNAVIAKYGAERVQVVLANTVQCKDYDGRFSAGNKQWAQGIQLPQQSRDQRTSYVCETHPAILDGFLHAMRKQQQEKKPSVVDQLKTPVKTPAPKKKEKSAPDQTR